MNTSKTIVSLHLFAGIILLCYAISHLAFLTIKDITLQYDNAVFPFLSNQTIFMIASFMEFGIGLCCCFYRGYAIINILITTFVGIIIWYRWAFFFVGGKRCNCLGIVGRLLHLSVAQEKVLPVVTLILLMLTTLPWWLRIARLSYRKAFSFTLLVLFFGILPRSNAGEAIKVYGEMDAARYNPVLGNVFTNTRAHIGFTVTIAEKTWIIRATNLNDSIYWTQVFYDGTNIITLCPKGNDFWIGERPSDNTLFATIASSPLYVAPVDDTLGIACIYVTYILSPDSIPKDKLGFFQMPMPWLAGRKTLGAYGNKWLINASRGRFIEDFEVVRDHKFDLSDKEEFTRWEIDYPETAGDHDWFMDLIANRKETPDGFVYARYKCTEWNQTNNIFIPKESNLIYYLFGGNKRHPYNKPHYQAYLKSLSVIFIDDTLVFPQSPAMLTQVNDYRYKKATKERIYKYADYTLDAGETWKVGNDPALMAQVQKYLKNGPRIDAFAKRKNIVVWLLGVLIPMPLIIILLLRKKT